MPAVQPAELWQESGRWDAVRPGMLRFKDRHQRDFCLARPTRKSSPIWSAQREIRSYKQVPINFYPDSDQVPRRDPAALRRHARARIPDEGRLFLPPRRDEPGQTYQPCTRPTADLHPPGPEIPRRRGRHRRHRRQARTNSTCWPIPAKTPSPSARTPTTPPTSKWPRRFAPAAARPAPGKPCAKIATPGRRPARMSPRCCGHPAAKSSS
jgi:hypothetical protein